MAVSNQLEQTSVVTDKETITTTTYDQVSIDQLMLVMLRAEARAIFSKSPVGRVAFDANVKDTIIFPISQI